MVGSQYQAEIPPFQGHYMADLSGKLMDISSRIKQHFVNNTLECIVKCLGKAFVRQAVHNANFLPATAGCRHEICMIPPSTQR